MAVKKKKEATEIKPKEESAQSEVNIGFVGHVDHGKTTLNEALSGKWTDTHSEEMKKGITIRLGYADAVFRKCKKCNKYTTSEKCECGGETKISRKVSFVDAPGHESLMATMLAGSAIMDGALLIIAANEKCPQPQTREHLMALQIIGIKNVVIVQNKIDLASEEQALENYKQIKEFVKGTDYENAPIIPVSAQQRINIELLIEAIEKNVPTPKRDPNKDPIMFIARSFDINRPGASIEKINGGVLGGSVKQGILKAGQEIEIRPGREIIERNQKFWKPLKTTIVSLKSGGINAEQAAPGGSIGVMTNLDPAVVKSDRLVGNLAGSAGKLPQIWDKIKIEVHLLERVVGAEEELKVEPIKGGEWLMLNVNSAATVGQVVDFGKNEITCSLKLPVCAEKGSRMTISRRVGTRFRLIGYGIIK